VLDLRSRLMEQDELASQLLGWVHKNR
jgi:hypothetical protein